MFTLHTSSISRAELHVLAAYAESSVKFKNVNDIHSIFSGHCRRRGSRIVSLQHPEGVEDNLECIIIDYNIEVTVLL